MEVKNMTRNANKVFDIGVLDVVVDGVLKEDYPCKAVMVESSSDLANLPDYAPGTIAFTAGFGTMWQKDSDGTWQTLGGE